MTSALQYSIEIVANRRAAQSARREVSDALRTCSVGDEVRADVELLVSELVSNVVRHELAQVINLEVTVNDARAVTVTVTGGIAEPVAKLAHPAGAPLPSSVGGRGLAHPGLGRVDLGHASKQRQDQRLVHGERRRHRLESWPNRRAHRDVRGDARRVSGCGQ